MDKNQTTATTATNAGAQQPKDTLTHRPDQNQEERLVEVTEVIDSLP